MLGIGTISYHRFLLLMKCLRSIKKVCTIPHHLVVWDNNEGISTASNYIKACHPDITYLSEGTNKGCSYGRNRMLEYLLNTYGEELDYFLYLDQDVEMLPQSIDDMIEVAKSKQDWGAISWPHANMNATKIYPGGMVAEIAGMCSLYNLKALRTIYNRFGSVWDERFLFFRFDSLFSQRLVHEGYYTYLVMKYYTDKFSYYHQLGGVIHHHPHSGVRIHPNYHLVKKQSDDLYKSIQRVEGWTPWNPSIQGKPCPYYYDLRRVHGANRNPTILTPIHHPTK